MKRRKKIVIIGGGFGGLKAAKWLKKVKADVLLIDRTNYHLFQPLLYQVATGALAAAEIATSIRRIVGKQKNTRVIMGDVVQIDKVNNQLTLADGDVIDFDYLIVATGARHSYFGNDHFEKHAPGLKTLQDAMQIREKILLSFEKAELMAVKGGCPKEAMEKYLNFVIIGAGPTGVELAGAISEISHTIFPNFRLIKPNMAKIYLVEGADRVLQMLPPSLSTRAKKDLEKLGVQVLTKMVATNITKDGVEIGKFMPNKTIEDKEFIHSENIIWAAGNQASSIIKSLDVPVDIQGRAIVRSDLTIPDHDNIFVIGDAAHVKSSWIDENSRPLPAQAPLAIQTGKWVAHALRRELARPELGPKDRPPFVYFDKGSLATIGNGKAVGMYGKLRFKGLLAWLMWCVVHIAYLVGFRNRFAVMIEWTVLFITGQRGVRLIYKTSKKEKK